MSKYIKRLIDSTLAQELEAFGAVLITGPKWCGKTTTAKQIAKSALFMQDPDKRDAYLKTADLQPSALLLGEKPRLIDEWQMAPQLWDAVRFDVDKQGKEGLYILTGSTTVDEENIEHSGAGRISRLMMRTLSLFESEDSNGAISLKELFNNPGDISGISSKTIADVAKLIVRGGWPNSIGKKEEITRRQIAGYCDVIAKSEIKTIDGVQRDEEKTKAILRSFSRHISTRTPNSTILKDILSNNETLHKNTLDAYITALKKLYVIEDLTAWSPKLRSKTTIRTSDTRHFVDPAIAAFYLGANSKDLIYDPETFGLLFESMVIRDLRVYTQCLGGTVYHYKDKDGLEADAIIHLNDGRWGAFEVKLGAKWIDEAAKNLLALKSKIDDSHMNPPSFLGVITATEFTYKREDGILVVPLCCLRD